MVQPTQHMRAHQADSGLQMCTSFLWWTPSTPEFSRGLVQQQLPLGKCRNYSCYFRGESNFLIKFGFIHTYFQKNIQNKNRHLDKQGLKKNWDPSCYQAPRCSNYGYGSWCDAFLTDALLIIWSQKSPTTGSNLSLELKSQRSDFSKSSKVWDIWITSQISWVIDLKV